jgi:PPP family 3-phenylpropionic acid transporter
MPPAARLRLFYFLYFSGVGANLPYFAPYLRGLGFTGEQIGAVQMGGSLVAPVVALTWAAAADRLRAPSRALALAALLSAVIATLLSLARTPLALGAVILVWSLAERAVVPLVDTVTTEWTLANPPVSYARIRLFGSLGFIACAQGIGLLLAARGDRPGDILVPLVMAGSAAAYAIAARQLPASRALRAARPDRADVVALVRDRRFLALLAACGVHWLACAPYHLLFGVFVRDHGLPSSVTGLSMTVGVGAEVVALLVFPRFESRLSSPALLAMAFGASCLRWALLANASTASAIVVLQLLHGFTFGVFWATSMRGISAIVPAPLSATGQALYTAVVFGAGNSAGYLLAGLGYDRLGGVGPVFVAAAGVEGLLFLATCGVLLTRGGARRGRPVE